MPTEVTDIAGTTIHGFLLKSGVTGHSLSSSYLNTEVTLSGGTATPGCRHSGCCSTFSPCFAAGRLAGS